MMTKDDGNWSIDLDIFHLNSLIMKMELKLEMIINQKGQGWTCFTGNLLITVSRSEIRNISKGSFEASSVFSLNIFNFLGNLLFSYNCQFWMVSMAIWVIQSQLEDGIP